MIDFITILIILVICTGVWTIQKLNYCFHKINNLQKSLDSCTFNGNLTEYRLILTHLNKKINEFLSSQKKQQSVENFNKIANTILFSFSIFKWLKRRLVKKH